MMDILSILITMLIQTLAKDVIDNLAFETNNLVDDGREVSDVSVRISDWSRRKRFIVFDEGSSLQLDDPQRYKTINGRADERTVWEAKTKDVDDAFIQNLFQVFCTTYPTIFAIGDIFLWGYTVALAFDLPQDPYSPFRHHADPLHRRIDTKAIYYTDEDGKIIYKRPYQRKVIAIPTIAKRSIFTTMKAGEFKKGVQDKFKTDRKQMHASTHKREFLKREHMDTRSVDFHRSSRRDFYMKIETMLQGVGMNGRQCLLKTLCLTGQSQDIPQGHFIQELLRAVFTLPKSDVSDENYKEYDEALAATESCSQLYPECEDDFNTTESLGISS